MNWSDISFNPSRKMLRQFSGLWIVFFLFLAYWQGYLRDRPTVTWVLAILAVTVGPLGLLAPQIVRPIFVAWMVVAFPIGWTISRILLAVLFYAVFTPIGFIFRLIGRDALALKPHPASETYWTPKPTAASARSYFRQF
jgi:hypothetical protein